MKQNIQDLKRQLIADQKSIFLGADTIKKTKEKLY